MDGDRPRRSLVRSLIFHGAIRSDRVREAFLAVPREIFVPDVLAEHGMRAVYSDEALAVKRDEYGVPISSSSQPAIMAEMLEHLDVQPGMKVLEIGTGTGYNAALLKHLSGPGQVVTVDLERDLAEKAKERLVDLGYEVDVVVGDGAEGWKAGAPYDRIMATASVGAVPPAWIDQLVEGGRLVTPLRPAPNCSWPQVVVLFERTARGLTSRALIPGGFMNLRAEAGQPARETGASRASPPADVLAEEPRTIPISPEPPRYDFDVFLALRLDPARLTERDRKSGDPRLTVWSEGSIALPGGNERDYRSRGGLAAGNYSWIEARGGPEAERALTSVYREWVEWGCPRLADLIIEVKENGETTISSAASRRGS